MVKLSAHKVKKSAGFAVMFVTALSLQACSTVTGGGKQALRDSVGAGPNSEQDVNKLDPVAAAAFWGTRFDREPNNPEVAVSFSSALRKIGSHEEALRVISKTATNEPNNVDVKFEFGKVLIEDNRAFEAVRHLEDAQQDRPDDWRVISAYGVALDQIGEHKAAQEKYSLALSIAPEQISILNNQGLSYALSGDLAKAHTALVKASGRRHASSRVRQNLALVSALRGDVKTAERLARSDLPPQVADNNVAYFQDLLTQPAYWQDLSASEVDSPSFDVGISGNGFGTGGAIAAPVEVPDFDAPTIEPPVVEDNVIEVEPLPSLKPSVPEVEEPEDDLVGAPLVLGPLVVPSTTSFNKEADDETNESDTDEREGEEDEKSDDDSQ